MRTWLLGILMLLQFLNAFADPGFAAFWRKFSSAVIAGDKVTVAEMTKFPLSMPYLVKTVKNMEEFLRPYDEIFKGEANAAQCFAKAEPQKESARQYDITAPSRNLPTTWKTRRFATFSNEPKAAGDLSVSITSMNDAS